MTLCEEVRITDKAASHGEFEVRRTRTENGPCRGVFVGRDGELDAVLTAIGTVGSAGLSAAVVTGEAGIGKSRLIGEVADRLRRRGWRLLRVRGDRLERSLPYGVLSATLRAVAADNAFADGLRREAIASVEMSTQPSPAVGGAFGRACAAVGQLLTALTASSPLGIIVDDLHELDDDSLALLAVVLNRLNRAPIGLVAAMRSHIAAPNAAAEELVSRLADGVDVVRVELSRLGRADIAVIMADTLGAAPDERLVEAVHRRADGNPYFAMEIARSLADADLVTVDGANARLVGARPQEVHLSRRATVLRRVVPLDEPTQAVAQALAVLRGADLGSIGLLASVTSLPEASVVAAFDDLVRAHVVVAGPDGIYRFSHDIVCDAVYDEIGPAQRRRLHALCAERLLTDHANTDLLRLAWHLSESATPGDARAAEVLATAAQHTLAGAPEAAAGFCARALSLLGPTAPERADLLSLQCRAQARASRPAAAAASGTEALALLPPGDQRFHTAVAILASLFSLGRVDEAIAVADDQVHEPGAPATLHAQRAMLLVFADRTDEALNEAELATSTSPVSPAEEVVVHGQLGMLNSMLFLHGESVRCADRALASAGSSVTLQLQALGVAASTTALAGLVRDAAYRVRQAQLLTQQTDGPHPFETELAVARIVVDWLQGRWDSALEGMRTVTGELVHRQYTMLATALVAAELEMRTWRGELVLTGPLAASPPAAPRNVASLHAWAKAGLHLALGESLAARAVLLAAIEAPGTPTYLGLLLSRLCELEVEQGDADAAERAVRRLVDESGIYHSPWATTTLHRTVGLVRGDPDTLGEAVRVAETEGLVFERARAQLILGQRETGRAEILVEAHQTFSLLGAHGLRRVAARRLHELGAKVPRARSRAAGLLTPSEEQVARLVQQGMRNRDIAAALHLSPRSVEVYLSRMYGKLRVASRLELARALDAMDSSG